MKRRDLLSQISDSAIVPDNVVSNRQALCTAGLGREHASCPVIRFAVTGRQAPFLRVFIAIDNEDAIDKIPEGGIYQQWHYDDLIRHNWAD